MPPISTENSYTPENSIPSHERYLDIERGDVSPAPPPQQNDDQTNQQQQQQTGNTQQSTPPQQQKPIDPVELVKGMISAGFTPTKAQIMNATNNLAGSNDSTNTWFAIFLQRLIKQEKLRRSKNGGR
jgi:hypothetical protein